MVTKPTNKKRLTLDSDEPSLLFAVNQLLLTGGIDFDEWWKEFVKPPIDSKTKKPLTDWTKPKFVDRTPKTNESIGRWIRYFPDKDDEINFYDLSGTDRDLVHHITAIGYQQGGESGGIPGKNSKPQLEGFPLIELYFYSPDRKKGVKRIRCVGYTDAPKIANLKLAQMVTSADIKRWAAKIKTVEQLSEINALIPSRQMRLVKLNLSLTVDCLKVCQKQIYRLIQLRRRYKS